jgi:hypothetical protein
MVATFSGKAATVQKEAAAEIRKLHAKITYVGMRLGFLYLVAVMDWHSRVELSWRLFNTLDADFCVAALEEVNLPDGAGLEPNKPGDSVPAFPAGIGQVCHRQLAFALDHPLKGGRAA